MSIMPLEQIPDWDKRLARMDAFWDREIIDRPPFTIQFPAPVAKAVGPSKTFASLRDRWMDSEYLADAFAASVKNTCYFGDALPHAFPNFGPEIFTAFFGQELFFGEETSWSEPLIEDWDDLSRLKFSRDNYYFRKLEEFTRILIEKGRGLYYTGLTDFHPGGDALAALRDPQNLNTDLLLYPNQVHALLEQITSIYLKTYDYFYDLLRQADQPVSSWPGIVSACKWYVPSNDFSCMISQGMFRDFFLDGIVREIRHFGASIYHLDGPNALQHLDALLEIPELNAIQWVWGAGHGRASDWRLVLQRCQSAGKAIEIHAEADELDLLMENLRPEGTVTHVFGVQSQSEAEAIEGKFQRWGMRRR